MTKPIRLSRRSLLKLGAILPAGALLAACGDEDNGFRAVQDVKTTIEEGGDVSRHPAAAELPLETEPEPSATEEPFIVAAGEEQRMLMQGTRYETPLYIFGSGRPGPVITVLGGVHGNEPGSWLAAERLLEDTRPESGAFILVPHANTQAIALFERTTAELGDLNRLYPGDPEGVPMAQMAHEIVETLREFRSNLLIDMHESWGFFRDRGPNQSGPAFLGQTLSGRGEYGVEIAQTIAETINTQILWPHEELIAREWPPSGAFAGPTPAVVGEPGSPPGATQGGGRGGGRSSLGLPNHVTGLSAILVEMGQQQEMERRVQLHVDVVTEAMKILGAT